MNPSVQTDDARFLELLERWLRGDFNRSDEQELRTLVDADGFRREAWEGFIVLPEENHELRLVALRRHLRARTAPKRVPVRIWMAAAAVFVALAAAVYFLPRFGPKEPAPVARTSPVPAEQSGESKSAVAAPEAGYHPESPGSSKSAIRPSAPAASTRASDLAAPEERAAGDKPAGAMPVSVETAPSRMADSSPVVAGGPASYQQLPPTPPTLGGPAANMPAQPANPADAKAGRDANQQAEDMPADDETRTKKSEAAKPVAAPGQPAEGWEAFFRYLRRNARLTDAARNNNISGKVRLQFNVGPGGKPEKVQILKGLGYGCDEEAVRLVNAFSWTAGDGNPVTVEIPFVR